MIESIAEVRAAAAERKGLKAVRALVSEPSDTIRVTVGHDSVDLPRSLVQVLLTATEALEEGGTVAVVSEAAEVSPAGAAKLLGVSRQYVDRLIDAGVLPVRRLPRSSYKRIPVRAVLIERARKERKREAIGRIVDTAVHDGAPY